MDENLKYFYNPNGTLLAILISSDFRSDNIKFLTSDDQFQQVAYMSHKQGHIIVPHYHNIIERKVSLTCETLIIKKGILKVSLFDNKNPLCSFDIKSGDILTLLSGGHGFEVIEDVEMVEIKQGPFLGDIDKTRF